MSHARLIVNADDLGLTPERDRAIADLFGIGAVTSSTLIVNGTTAKEAARLAGEIGLPLGLHLNLTEGVASAGPSALTDSAGQLPGKFGLRPLLGKGEPDALRQALEQEIRAQVDAFRRLTGQWPTHVDGHHHAHIIPVVAATLAPILSTEYGITRIRLPLEDDEVLGAFDEDPTTRNFQRQVNDDLAQAREIWADHGLIHPDAFIGRSLMGRRMTPEAVTLALAHAAAQAQTIELMVHPGYISTAGNDFGREPDRETERASLRAVLGDGVPWPTGLSPASFRDILRPPPRRQRILILSKLSPASGNRTTALRLGEHLRERGDILFRPLPPEGPKDTLAWNREINALRDLAHAERLTAAFGIHCSRAGSLLRAAFGADSPCPLPYLLLASGTDIHQDAADPVLREDIRLAIAHAAGVASLSAPLTEQLRSLFGSPETLAAPVTAPVASPFATLPQAPSIESDRTFSLRAHAGLDRNLHLALLPAGIRPVKGIALAIEAAAQALLNHPDWAVIIMGPILDADYHAHCHSLIREWSLRHRALKGRLKILPPVSREDYLAALREVDILLNTSESEGMANTVLEAQGAGVAVLASDIPGNRAVIGHDTNGRLYAGLAGFVREFGELGSQPELRRRLATAGLQSYAHLCQPVQERAGYLALFDAALAHRGFTLKLRSGGTLNLLLAEHTHAPDPANLELFALALPPEGTRKKKLRVLDLGCGSGVFGALVADRLVSAGWPKPILRGIDADTPSLAALRHGMHCQPDRWDGLTESALLWSGDLFRALPPHEPPFDLILINLPQTPAPEPLPIDRFGGHEPESEGAGLLGRAIRELPQYLADDGLAMVLHIGLAHPGAVQAAIDAAELEATIMASQDRRVPVSAYDALQPGLSDFLLEEAKHGRAIVAKEVTEGDAFLRFPARLLCLRKVSRN